MKNWVKAVIGVGAAAVGGIVTLGILGRDEKTDIVDAEFKEADDNPFEEVPDDDVEETTKD